MKDIKIINKLMAVCLFCMSLVLFVGGIKEQQYQVLPMGVMILGLSIYWFFYVDLYKILDSFGLRQTEKR